MRSILLLPLVARCLETIEVCIYLLCVCVGDVIDVVFSVYIVRRRTVGARVWEV